MNTNQPPEGGRDANVREVAKDIGRAIDEALPAEWGFFLCMFPFNNTAGRVNYIGNAQREQVLVMLRNLVQQLEVKPQAFGQHTDDIV